MTRSFVHYESNFFTMFHNDMEMRYSPYFPIRILFPVGSGPPIESARMPVPQHSLIWLWSNPALVLHVNVRSL